MAALDDAFARETAETNARRLRVMAPIMATVHVAHIAHFRISPSLRATLPADVQRWRDWLVLAHALMLPTLALLCALVFVRSERAHRLAGPATVLAYLLHGAFVAGVDQIVTANISAYIAYCFGCAVILPLPARASVPIYLAGGATLIASLRAFSSSPGALGTNLPTSMTLTTVSVAIGWLLYANRRRDFEQRTTIERQREELTALNAGLEARVQAQVAEIVQRAAEVERLNAQLQAQVRARSGELSLALARLARGRESQGSLADGAVLAGRFTVERRIGRGGMGTVYAGLDQSTGARVAIKVIQAGSSDELDAMRRFIREAGAAATVSHAAVVRVLHVDVSDDGLLFQVQELVDGQTLSQRLRGWTPVTAARLGAVLCDALAAVHARGVVHRDLKPDNVMLTTAPPGLKLLDFGIAKLYDAVGRGDGTRARMIIGTPGYMAPEQAAATAEVSDRADVFAVGVILFELLTGELPSAGRSCASVPLGPTIERCLALEPSARPAAAEVGRELARLADEHGAAALEEIVAVRAPPTGDVSASSTVQTAVGKATP